MVNNRTEMTVNPDGTKEWYQNGILHRIDGPAVEHFDGTKEWFVNGKLHREDGPAIEHSDGSKAFYLFGEKIKNEKVYKASSSILQFIWLKHGKQ